MQFLNIRNLSCCPSIRRSWDPLSFSENDRRTNTRFPIDISVRNIFTRTTTRAATWIFCDEIVQSAQLFSKYYTWNIKAFISIAIIGTNVFLGSMVPIFQQALREFINNAIKNSNEFSLYIYPLIYLLSIILSIASVHALNGVLCKKLRDDLASEMRDELLKSWSDTNAWNEYQHTTSGSKIKNPEVDIVIMGTSLCRHLVDLINARLSTLSLFVGALRSMYLNSGFLTLSFLGITIELPYLILVCFLYVYAFSKASFWTNAVFKKNTEDEQEAINVLIKHANEVYEKYKHARELYKKHDKDTEEIHKRSLLLLIDTLEQKNTEDVQEIIDTWINHAKELYKQVNEHNELHEKYDIATEDTYKRSLILSIHTLTRDNKSIHDINKRSLLPQFGLSFLNRINSDLSTLTGACVLLASGNIDGITIAYMAQNFSYAAVLASWHRVQLENIKKLDVARERTLHVFAVPDELNLQKDTTITVDG